MPRSSAPIYLAGPTSVGKSAVALALAERLGGEIISVDSMQVYRGLDLGTAKPSPAERARVRHHLIDVADLTEAFDAQKFVRLAQQALTDIQTRGSVPIFCGGTGLYFKALLEGLGDAPPADPALRAELEATPLTELLRELEQRDLETFRRIDRDNPRRVIRALEVIRLTGKPFSVQRAPWGRPSAFLQQRRPEQASGQITDLPSQSRAAGAKAGGPAQLPVLFCLTRAPADLHSRIESRVEDMFRRGLVDETKQLLARGLEQNRTALQAIGYRQVVEHLRGARALAETVALVKQRTRQFAKRQLTWFRHQLPVRWIELEPHASPETTAEALDRSRGTPA